MLDWIETTRAAIPEMGPADNHYYEGVLKDPELSAQLFIQERRENTMASRRKKEDKPKGFQLPTTRRSPVADPWRYAYLFTGEKKIGKTSWAINGCEELVLQFDKPQLAYEIREEVIESWRGFIKILNALEEAAESGDFPYNRLVIDGVSEWYAMCQTSTCKHFGIDHPSEEGFAKGWHHLRDNFTKAVNRLMRLQESAKCGIVFIAHADWKEVTIRGGGKVEKLVPNLPGTCEEIVNGKVDAWFCYDYVGLERIMIVRGDQHTGAGHRIDGHFLTPEGARVREIHMGDSATEGMANFNLAFENKQDYTTYNPESSDVPSTPKKNKRKKPAATRRKSGRGE